MELSLLSCGAKTARDLMEEAVRSQQSSRVELLRPQKRCFKLLKVFATPESSAIQST
jgi:hypothetical protein